MLGKFVELARGREHQAPPQRFVWQALADPTSDQVRSGYVWFRPQDDEQIPQIVRSVEPSEVVWTALWPDRPELRVIFEIEPRRYGGTEQSVVGSDSTVTWILRGPDGSLTAEDLERRIRRLRHLTRLDLAGMWDQ